MFIGLLQRADCQPPFNYSLPFFSRFVTVRPPGFPAVVIAPAVHPAASLESGSFSSYRCEFYTLSHQQYFVSLPAGNGTHNRKPHNPGRYGGINRRVFTPSRISQTQPDTAGWGGHGLESQPAEGASERFATPLAARNPVARFGRHERENDQPKDFRAANPSLWPGLETARCGRRGIASCNASLDGCVRCVLPSLWMS